MPDFEVYYRAMASRDPRFDGRFVVAVTSTGVYCRPVCPSRTPKRANSRFFPVPAAAEAAGFRACRRCRPDSAPESADWNVRGDLVARALRLIASGTADEDGVSGLARRLAVSERHLHRQLVAEVGVGPQALALSRRAQVARLLIESKALPLADIAFAAGYSSIRQFNHGIRAAFGCTPGELRGDRGGTAASGEPLVLRLRHRPPLAASPLLSWFAARALAGVETVDDTQYRRTVRLPRSTGWVALTVESEQLTVRLGLTDLRDTAAAVRLCRDMFDLDADPAMIAEVLAPDPLIGPLIAANPGLRVPGSPDGFEFAVRAVLGPYGTIGARLIDRWGEPVTTPFSDLTHLFPTPDRLAEADLAAAGLSRPRADTIRALAHAACRDAGWLNRYVDRAQAVAALRAIPGIGPRTACQVAMHALGDPDAFPVADTDLVDAANRLGAGQQRLDELARHWRPWRSYAAVHLRESLR